jgi:DNA repair protein RecO (recombination protein O)
MSFYKEATGYLIHQRKFKNSSLIIEFFSKEFGMIHLIAKGIKNNKILNSQLQFFHLLKIQFYGKSHLKTVVSINSISPLDFNGLLEKTAGFYLNELIHYSLLENEPANLLFVGYSKAIHQLGLIKLTPILRGFEKLILKHNGFELNIDSYEELDEWLCVDENFGLIKSENNQQKICTVGDLQKFLNAAMLNNEEQKRVNKVMMHLINLSVSHKRLFSRELLIDLTKK